MAWSIGTNRRGNKVYTDADLTIEVREDGKEGCPYKAWYAFQFIGEYATFSEAQAALIDDSGVPKHGER